MYIISRIATVARYRLAAVCIRGKRIAVKRNARFPASPKTVITGSITKMTSFSGPVHKIDSGISMLLANEQAEADEAVEFIMIEYRMSSLSRRCAIFK